MLTTELSEIKLKICYKNKSLVEQIRSCNGQNISIKHEMLSL